MRRKQKDADALIQKEKPADDLPLINEFFEFAYSDNGANDPLTTLLEREETEGMTLEIITTGNITTIHFTYKD